MINSNSYTNQDYEDSNDFLQNILEGISWLLAYQNGMADEELNAATSQPALTTISSTDSVNMLSSFSCSQSEDFTKDYQTTFNKYPSTKELEAWALYTDSICRGLHLMTSDDFEMVFSRQVSRSATEMGMPRDDLVALAKKVAIEFYMVNTPFHDPRATSHLGGFIPKNYRKNKERVAALALQIIQLYLRMKDRQDALCNTAGRESKEKMGSGYADYYLVFKRYPTEELYSLWTSLTLPAVIASQKGPADEYETAFVDLLASTAIAVDMGEKELLAMVQKIAADYFRIFQRFHWDARDVRLVDLIPEKYGRNVLNIAALVLAYL